MLSEQTKGTYIMVVSNYSMVTKQEHFIRMVIINILMIGGKYVRRNFRLLKPRFIHGGYDLYGIISIGKYCDITKVESKTEYVNAAILNFNKFNSLHLKAALMLTFNILS